MGNLRNKPCVKDWELKEYEKFIKKLKLVENDEITVKVNQKFGAEFSANYTIAPEFQEDMPSFEKAEEGIKFIESRSFYPHPDGWTGGDTVVVNIFKATKKGNFKIKFGSHEIKVIVI